MRRQAPQTETPTEQPSRTDRWLASLGHGSVLISVFPPIILFAVSASRDTPLIYQVVLRLIYLIGPAVALLVLARFARRGSVWGKIQGLQAAVFQGIVTVVGLIAPLEAARGGSRLELLQLVVLLGAIYGVRGALDVALGRTFRYILLGRWIESLVKGATSSERR